MAKLLVIIALIMASMPFIISAQPVCARQWVCIEVQEKDNKINFVFTNKRPYAVSITLQSYGKNVRPDTDFTTSFTLNGQETRRALTLTVNDPKKKWSYRYEYDWVVGSLEARHDDSYLYRLPFAARVRYPILQGMNGGYSHKGLERYAVDFDMPDGSAIHAAREGIVADVKDDQRDFDPTSRCTLPANYIKIQHPDGTTGEYIHLQYEGVLVKSGQPVKRGQLIGRSGNTGCSNQPHLHFAVYKAVPGPYTQSLPIKFISKQGIVKTPRHGDIFDPAPQQQDEKIAE